MNDIKYLELSCIKVTQPIGDFFIGSIKARDLCEITKYDFRRLSIEEGFSSYLGIQRKVNPQRVKEISKYVGTRDACFPTAVILAVPGKCAEFNKRIGKLRLTEYQDKDDPSHGRPAFSQAK